MQRRNEPRHEIELFCQLFFFTGIAPSSRLFTQHISKSPLKASYLFLSASHYFLMRNSGFPPTVLLAQILRVRAHGVGHKPSEGNQLLAVHHDAGSEGGTDRMNQKMLLSGEFLPSEAGYSRAHTGVSGAVRQEKLRGVRQKRERPLDQRMQQLQIWTSRKGQLHQGHSGQCRTVKIQQKSPTFCAMDCVSED